MFPQYNRNATADFCHSFPRLGGNAPKSVAITVFSLSYAEPIKDIPQDFVLGGAQTGGVYEAEEVAAYGHRLFHRVAGGAGDVGDYGAVITYQGVQKGALAGVDGSHYGDRNTVAKGVAVAEGVCQ